MVGVVHAVKHEVLLLADRGGSGEMLEELGFIAGHAVYFIIGGYGDEHVAVCFLRGEVVDAVLIGGGHFISVGNHHAGHTQSVA